MRSVQLNEIDESTFHIQNIQDVELTLDNGQFSEMIPLILDFLDPHEELTSAQKRTKKNKKRKVAKKESFREVKVRDNFYSKLNSDYLEEILNYLFINHQEDRLVNLFNSVDQEVQVKIIKDMLHLAFDTKLASYGKEVVAIRRKIANRYIKSAKSMDEAENTAFNGDYLKTMLFLKNNTDKINSFLVSFESNHGIINNVLRGIMKLVPMGKCLMH